MRHFIALIFIACLQIFSACKAQRGSSEIKFLAADRAAMNVALLASGDKSGGIAAGTDSDIRLMNETMPQFGFKTVVLDETNASTLAQKSAEVAGQMLQTSPTGTLLWFITTHGSPSGDLSMADGGMTTFNNIAAAMRQARGQKSFKRLIVFIEACFSGNNIDGQTAINQNTGNQFQDSGMGPFNYGIAAPSFGLAASNDFATDFMNALFRIPTQPQGGITPNTKLPPMASPGTSQYGVPQNWSQLHSGLYEQLIIITSSTSQEYSYVTGEGSYAVLAFTDSLRQLPPTATIADLFRAMQQNNGGSQTLQFKADPEQILSDKLFN